MFNKIIQIIGGIITMLLGFFVMKKKALAEINATTYQFKDGDFDTEIGDIHSADFQPQVKIKRWDNECNFSVRLIDDDKSHAQVITEGNKIKFVKRKTECHFYNVPKEENKPFTAIRHIKLGKLSPTEMSATYDLFRKVELEQPTIITYRPNQEMFWLEGRYSKERDLILEKIDKPIARYDTAPYFKMMSVDENTLIGDFVYYSGQADSAGKMLVSAVSEVLANYGIEIEEKTAGRLFIKGTNNKFLSFARHGDNHFVYYIRLKAPAFDYRSYYKEHTQGDYEHIGLQEVNSEITASIIDEINENLVERLGFQFIQNSLTTKEKTALQELQAVLSKNEWVENGERDDILSVRQDYNAYEFEVILNEKPKSNLVQMSVETKGLNFYYQPELHPDHPTYDERTWNEERQDWDYNSFRPENVVGSYAVYHESKAGDYSKMAGKNYMAGKAFHIYRPKIIDSAGTEVWGELNITNNLLTVEIPQEFLDNAVYPVRHAAGLEFGFEGSGASGACATLMLSQYVFSSYYYQAGGKATPAQAGNGSKISAYIYNSYTAGTPQVKFGLFKVSDWSLVASTNAVNLTLNTATEFIELDFISQPSLTTQEYLIAAAGSSGTTGPGHISNIRCDSGGVAGQAQRDNIASFGFVDPFTSNANQNLKPSIYCTYTAGGATYRRRVLVGSYLLGLLKLCSH